CGFCPLRSASWSAAHAWGRCRRPQPQAHGWQSVGEDKVPIDANDVHWVKPPKMGLAVRMYLPAIFEGLATTVKHLFKPKLTQEYPEQRPKLPPNYRGVHRLNRDEQDRVKCVACYMCSTACPAHCIDIVAAPAPGDWKDREKYPETFVIDELRCIYCGMC